MSVRQFCISTATGQTVDAGLLASKGTHPSCSFLYLIRQLLYLFIHASIVCILGLAVHLCTCCDSRHAPSMTPRLSSSTWLSCVHSFVFVLVIGLSYTSTFCVLPNRRACGVSDQPMPPASEFGANNASIQQKLLSRPKVQPTIQLPSFRETFPQINDVSVAKAPRPARSSPQHAPNLSSVLQNDSRSVPLKLKDHMSTSADDNIKTSAVGQLDKPPSTHTTVPNLPASPVFQGQGNVLIPSITRLSPSPYPSVAGQNSRRILIPRSPSSAREGPPPRPIDFSSGTIGAIALPSTDRLSTTEFPMQILSPPSAGAPFADLSHTNPRSTRSASACSASAISSQIHHKRERRPSDRGLPYQLPTSQSNSLSKSYSSYSRFSNALSTPHIALATAPPPSFSHPHTESNPGSSMPRPKASSSPVSSVKGQKYQLMTFNTNQGLIQVPVDVQGASKVADEKRKRNATASHLLRQRRKEKDRETTNTITKLKHQLHEVAEERNFYRKEATYFQSVACSTSGQAHAPRPPYPGLGQGH